ncbi:MAG: adenosylcobalamin-dependent ribonucleoside-diphosphate reductase [Candidatus Micrarchaeaceae archaeon]
MAEEELKSLLKDIPQETLDFFKNDEIRARVFYEKYTLKDFDGTPIEKTPLDMWRRVAREIASVEKEEKRKEWEENFYWLLEDFKFVPGGRIMFGAGQKGRKVTLLNCYVIPIKEDSIEAIFDWCKEAARTYSYGGGVGADVSILRPKGAVTHNAALRSSGPVSFMEIMSETTHTIGQEGRRGALMITISVEHPDVVEFIHAKRDLNKIRYANISVRVTDSFMRAVENDEEFTLHFENEVVGKIEKKVRARDIWNELIANARDWAEPGLLFWDTIKRYSPSEYNGMEVITTNPCSEQPLQPYGACDLGNINLSYFVIDQFKDTARIDWDSLEKAIRFGVRFLDNVLDYNANKHPLKAQSEAVLNSRRIGLGVTGLADMFAKLKIKYDSEEAIRLADILFERIKLIAYEESIELAKEKGPFPLFDAEKHCSMEFVKSLPKEIQEKIKSFGLRNVAILTIPPVGSGSVLAGTSSGIEPIFAFSYIRRSESLSKETFKVYHPLVKEYMDMYGLSEESQLPSFFIEAHKIKPEFRVKLQATIQKHIDSAISSTVNLPSTATKEEVGNIYFLAWKLGCKGITVYREGSREGVLITEEESKKKEKEEWSRPEYLSGTTIKMNTAQGSLYVTANFENGSMKEVFINLGKTGSDEKSYAEAIGRLISKYLQLGGDAEEIIKSLKGIRANSSTFWDKGLKIYSIPDAIAKALELALNKSLIAKPLNEPLQNEEGVQKSLKEKSVEPEVCPKCGEKAFINESGCFVCKSCGYTKCE